MTGAESSPPGASPSRTRWRHTAVEIGVLAALWLLFSGKLDRIHLSYGVISVTLVVLLTRHLVVARSALHENTFLQTLHPGRALVYPFWLLGQIVMANLQVAALILHPRLPIDPVLVRFTSRLGTAVSKVTLGNSITLTPGTFTLDIDGQEFLVHAITQASASSLLLGEMQRKVAAVYGETEYDKPRVLVSRELEPALKRVDP